jgi:hypothetical protein
VRDGQATLEAALDRLEAALPRGRSVHWCIVESDSSDNSAELLSRLAGQRQRFTALSLGTLRECLPLRTARIAHCRNAYLAWLREATGRAPISHVVVADLDGVIDRLDAVGLASCWHRDDWAACTANVDGPYYDIWALRHRLWCPGDCWREFDFLERLSGNADRARFAAVYSRMIRVPPETEWIEVESAFGGLALYRTEALLGARCMRRFALPAGASGSIRACWPRRVRRMTRMGPRGRRSPTRWAGEDFARCCACTSDAKGPSWCATCCAC